LLALSACEPEVEKVPTSASAAGSVTSWQDAPDVPTAKLTVQQSGSTVWCTVKLDYKDANTVYIRSYEVIFYLNYSADGKNYTQIEKQTITVREEDESKAECMLHIEDAGYYKISTICHIYNRTTRVHTVKSNEVIINKK
jgi:RNA-splicing ligase RtcB